MIAKVKLHKYIVIGMLCLIGQTQHSLVAQSLTLDKAIRLAQDSTLQAFESRYDYLRQLWNYKTYQSSTLPQVRLQANPYYLRSTFEPGLNYVSPLETNLAGTDLGLSYQQQIGRWGGYVYADSKALWSELLGDKRDQYGLDRLWGALPLRLGYRQELIGYNPFRWQKAIEEFHLERAAKELLFRMQQIAEQTTAYYFDYISAQEYYDTFHQNYLTTDTLYRISEKKFMLTTVTREELMSLQLERMNAKTQADNAYAELQNARYALLSYLRLPDEGQLLELTLPEAPATFLPDVRHAVQLAQQNAPEVLAYGEQVLEAEQALDLARKQSRLQINLDVSVGMHNYAGTFGKAYSNLEQYTQAQMGLSLPLYDGRKARNRKKQAHFALQAVQCAEQEQERLTEEQVVTTINLLAVRHRTLPEALAGLQLADEAFQLIQQRYANGQIDINTYMLAQSRKDQAHTLYTQLLCNFWMGYYKLCRLTMYDYIGQRPIEMECGGGNGPTRLP